MNCSNVVWGSTYEVGLQASWPGRENLQLTLCWLRQGGSCCGQGGSPSSLSSHWGFQGWAEWEGPGMQGFAPCLVVHLYLINNKQTTCVKVRAEGVILVHSNEGLQWTGKTKIWGLCKFRVFWGFFYIEPIGEPTDFLRSYLAQFSQNSPFQNNCTGIRTDHRKQFAPKVFPCFTLLKRKQ